MAVLLWVKICGRNSNSVELILEGLAYLLRISKVRVLIPASALHAQIFHVCPVLWGFPMMGGWMILEAIEDP